ncbi:MAG: hypothetical protein N4A63_07315 [Vallitalea sp.]|nr:hypothetical protein [Vallitalea sp.]
MNRNNERYMPSSSNLPMGQKRGYPYSKQPQPKRPMNNFKSQESGNARRLPPVITNTDYLQGYLRSKIGKFMKVNFLLGTGTFIDKEGVLQDVGVDHIVLRDIKTDEEVIADLYSIKFVEIPD